MNPELTPPPAPGDPYQFIMNPAKPKRHRWFKLSDGNDLIKKLVFIIGGAVLFMIVAAVAINFFVGDKNSLEDVVALTQAESEIMRVVESSSQTTDQAIKNAAANTGLSIASQQQNWLAFLQKHGRKVGEKELALKKNANTDSRLTAADEAGIFDKTFVQVVRNQLEAYRKDIKTTFDSSTNELERGQLQKDYAEVGLLLEQWPK